MRSLLLSFSFCALLVAGSSVFAGEPLRVAPAVHDGSAVPATPVFHRHYKYSGYGYSAYYRGYYHGYSGCGCGCCGYVYGSAPSYSYGYYASYGYPYRSYYSPRYTYDPRAVSMGYGIYGGPYHAYYMNY